jgi:hypothetical protein
MPSPNPSRSREGNLHIAKSLGKIARRVGLRRGDRRFAAIGFSIDANGVTLAVRYREGELASMLKRLEEMRTQSVPVICD